MSRHRSAPRRRGPGRRGSGRRGPGRLTTLLAVLTAAAAVATVATMVATDRTAAPSAASSAAPPAAVRESPPAAPAAAPAPPGPDLGAAVAGAEEAAAEAGPSGLDLGIAVHDRVTGATATGSAGDEVFNAASLAKVFVAVDVLDQRRRGTTDVDDTDLRQVRSALGPSSDPAMNALWSTFDGNAGVERLVERLDLADTTPPDDPSQWGEVQTSARDVVRLLTHVRAEAPAADRDELIGALTDPPARAADGFDQGYGLLDGSNEPVKQGWLCCLSDSVDMHTAGIVGDRFVVAVLTNQPRGWDRARATVDAATGSLRTALRNTPEG